ncbi:Phage integrase family protein [Micromonospora chersina]|uniref:Phage integrase family protein n=1 Tax=Micromonospora chersina TaxID=47854 RepID=A0A1C6VUX7_9ACTN|nr:Phage integrase family protein [Micromonospora chersina]
MVHDHGCHTCRRSLLRPERLRSLLGDPSSGPARDRSRGQAPSGWGLTGSQARRAFEPRPPPGGWVTHWSSSSSNRGPCPRGSGASSSAARQRSHHPRRCPARRRSFQLSQTRGLGVASWLTTWMETGGQTDRAARLVGGSVRLPPAEPEAGQPQRPGSSAVLRAQLVGSARHPDHRASEATGLETPLIPASVAGLDRLRPHDLRHACATFLLVSGASPRPVTKGLGHSQIGLTMNTYAHVLPDIGDRWRLTGLGAADP